MSTAWAGLFGKAPETGDFVVRGLPSRVRRALDLWVSAELAPRRTGWPDHGLRGLIETPEGPVLICAVESRDSAGRVFPLIAATDGAGLSFEAAEAWCDHLAPLLAEVVAGSVALDDAASRIADLPDLPREAEDGAEAVWAKGGDPFEADSAGLDAIFSSA